MFDLCPALSVSAILINLLFVWKSPFYNFLLVTDIKCIIRQAVFIHRGSDPEGLGGLYTLKINSQTQNQEDSHTVAFEDRGDANNFCFLLEAFFEELGDFTADIIPLSVRVRTLTWCMHQFIYHNIINHVPNHKFILFFCIYFYIKILSPHYPSSVLNWPWQRRLTSILIYCLLNLTWCI